MLGSGRPFYLELNLKLNSDIDLLKYTKSINEIYPKGVIIDQLFIIKKYILYFI